MPYIDTIPGVRTRAGLTKTSRQTASHRVHEHLVIVFYGLCPCVLRLCSGPWVCRMAL